MNPSSFQRFTSYMRLSKKFALAVCTLTFLGSCESQAAPDEIQVYLDDMDDVGQYGVEMHLNYVPKGAKAADPNAIASNHRFQLTPEFSYGFSKEWEGGLYIPTAISEDGSAYANGVRLRMKYVHQNDHPSDFFWGLNTEFGYTNRRVTDSPWAMEIRPIIGLRTDHWLFAVNPIISVPLSNGGLRKAEFEPSIKVMRKVSERVDLGLEHYSSLGPINHLQGWSKQTHEIYAAADIKGKDWDVNLGIGRGYQNAEDDWVIKAIVALPFN